MSHGSKKLNAMNTHSVRDALPPSDTLVTEQVELSGLVLDMNHLPRQRGSCGRLKTRFNVVYISIKGLFSTGSTTHDDALSSSSTIAVSSFRFACGRLVKY